MDLKQLLEDLREVQSNLDSGYQEEAENLLNFVIGELAVALTSGWVTNKTREEIDAYFDGMD